MDLSVIEKFEIPAKTLKLSEAIRIGAKYRPQCTRAFYHNGASCALGAALEAVGKREEQIAYREKSGCWEWSAIGDNFGPEALSICMQAAIKNDSGETREQVADWLEERGY